MFKALARSVKHEFEPVYDRDSKILILGTMPSPKSREFGFYYSHPQNRLWKVLSDIFEESAPSYESLLESYRIILKYIER
ncbi:MAG TPA: uracil-DNA glycosylase family protein [Anaerovoracaceae bacterium]|nr:uracil-DNA glycosylase family protein [Anaerovoracaceae bacterium]